MSIIKKKAVEENKRLEEWYEKTSEKLPLSESIIVKNDVPYINDRHARHTFDVYYKKHDALLPVIFDFHGGGFISGNKKYNKWFGEAMANHGFIVFTFAYPLAFESKLYDILKDCYEGMKVAYDMLEELGGDANNIFLCGDSAGGFLATYLAAINNDYELAYKLGIEQKAMNIRAVGAISALFYCSKVDKNGIFLMRSTYFGKNYKKHAFWEYVNPEKEVYKHLPPVFGITSKGDFLNSYTDRFIDYLKKNGRQASLHIYDDKKLEHDFVCLNPELDETKDALNRMALFFSNKIF